MKRSESELHKGETIIHKASAQVLKPGLYIVATPIGNLRDITLRALDTLTQCDLILAEDTRRTGKLLSAYDIKTPLMSYHDHNTQKRIPEIIAHMNKGKILALVSDAGTPLISDPGFKLVRSISENGHDVIPVPGASALLASLMVAGLPSDQFSFIGFLPQKQAARKKALEDAANLPGTLIAFETGPRLYNSLTDMFDIFGERPAVLARELTKLYEDIKRMPLSELITIVSDHPPKGELVILIGADTSRLWDKDAVDTALKTLLPELGAKAASQDIAKLSGWKKRDVYSRALQLK